MNKFINLFQQDLDLVMEPKAGLERLLFKGDLFAIRTESEQLHSYLIILVVSSILLLMHGLNPV